MLVDLATTVETLHPLESASDDSLVQLLHFLRKHAVLHLTTGQREELKVALRDGSGDRSSSLLKEILRVVPWRRVGAAPEDAVEIKDLLMSGAPVVIVDKNLATRLAIDELVPRTAENPEVIRAGYLSESPTCERVQSLPSSVGRAISREEVWTDRLAPLVRVSDSTKIYDRYVLDDSGGTLDWKPGIKWLFGQMKSSRLAGLNIEVITMPPSEVLPKATQIQNLLDKTLLDSGDTFSQISMTVCKGNASLRGGPKLSEPFHDRVLLFVCNGHARAISLGGGLDMFAASFCRSGSVAYHPAVEKEPLRDSLSEINRIIAGANPSLRTRGSVRPKVMISPS
jgi:hypothetical protein